MQVKSKTGKKKKSNQSALFSSAWVMTYIHNSLHNQREGEKSWDGGTGEGKDESEESLQMLREKEREK